MNTKLPAPSGARVINVALPRQAFDLEQVQKLTANLMKNLGHVACFSGFDIRFFHEDDYRVNPATLDVQSVALHP